MNRALKLFDPFIIPLLQVFWTLFATLNGGIYFREFYAREFRRHDVSGFVAGVLIIFLGVYFLAPTSRPSRNPSKENLSARSKFVESQHARESDRNPGDPNAAVTDLIHEIDASLDVISAPLREAQYPPLAAHGARNVKTILEEAQNFILGNEGEGWTFPAAPPTHIPSYGNGDHDEEFFDGGVTWESHRLVSFVGDMPVLIASERSVTALDSIIPSLSSLDGDDDDRPLL